MAEASSGFLKALLGNLGSLREQADISAGELEERLIWARLDHSLRGTIDRPKH